MEKLISKAKTPVFHLLKLAKKEQLTKNTYAFEFLIPESFKNNYRFESGQFVTLQYYSKGKESRNDYSMTSAPYEGKISLGIKCNAEESSSYDLIKNYNIGDEIEVSEPNGKFTLALKPNEHRTILGFASGIGITPILSHLKNILHTEKRTRFFLFYGNRDSKSIAFKEELAHLEQIYKDRFFVYHFYTQEINNRLFQGRLDGAKLNLIINQILHWDETDEENTIWDNVDEILICGPGAMIKSLANSSYKHGIPKKNIHFEIFEEFNEDIYPQEKEFPLVENIEVEFKLSGKNYHTILENNKGKLLQQLLSKGFAVPYSCKSGICGSCECLLEEGKVELFENEYLTEKEEQSGKILACMAVISEKKIKINFDID